MILYLYIHMSQSRKSSTDCGRGLKLTAHLHLAPRLGIRGTIPPLPILLHGVVLKLSRWATLPLPVCCQQLWF